MTRSLRARLFAVTAVVVLAALALVITLQARAEREWMLRHNASELERFARQAALLLSESGGAGSARLATLLSAADSSSGCRITLIARDGRVVADSRADASTLENHGSRQEIREALANRTGIAVRHSHSLGVDLQYVAIPARPGDDYAVMRVAEPLDAVRSWNRTLLELSLGAAIAALLAAFLLAYLFTGPLARRVAALEQIATRIGAGDSEARALETPEDELGRLGMALNRTSAALQARLSDLERERDEREHVLAHMTDGVALVDAQNRIVHCNHSLAAILGAARPAAPGTALNEFSRVPEIEDLLVRARVAGHGVESDLRLWTPVARFVRASAAPLGEEGGEVLLVLHDLTEVERVQRIRQDFVANVSHELRTPLTSLRGYAETLLDGGLEDIERREGFVRVIRDQADRLQALVEDLLSLAELERPEAGLRATRFDLRELLLQQVAVFRPAAERAGLDLALEAGGPIEISADRARLEQVVANLLDNAIKYTEHGGTTVRAGLDGACAWCEVADSGPGIPLEDQPRVFERFYRVDKARSRDKGGTGLGLSIVKHILELHRGQVSLRSEPGRGSTFRFELPRG